MGLWVCWLSFDKGSDHIVQANVSIRVVRIFQYIVIRKLSVGIKTYIPLKNNPFLTFWQGAFIKSSKKKKKKKNAGKLHYFTFYNNLTNLFI